MTRILVLLAVVLLIAYLVAEGVRRLRGKVIEMLGTAADGGRFPGASHGARRGGELVACAACGVHVPRARAIEAPPAPKTGTRAMAESRYYCSETCRLGSAERS